MAQDTQGSKDLTIRPISIGSLILFNLVPIRALSTVPGIFDASLGYKFHTVGVMIL